MTEAQPRLGLALSGGGYRASAFHLGTLKKLNELGILDRVEVLSTISGGSITGAAWCLHEGDYDSFHKKMINVIRTKSVIRFIFSSLIFMRTILFVLVFLGGAAYLSFTAYAWLVFPVLIVFFILFFRYQFVIFPVSKVIEKAYNKFLYEGKTLGELKSKPVIAIGSSNLHSGRPFTFSGKRMSDSAYSYDYFPRIDFKAERFPVARAVMASSCVPFAFTPVRIAKEFFAVETDFDRVRPVLIDGGVYDNQGIQKITQRGSGYECDIIITSDAGGNFRANKIYPNVLALLMRTVDLFMYRIKASQMVQNVFRNTENAEKPIAYFSLGWRIDNAIPGFYNNLVKGQVLEEVLAAHQLLPEWIANPEKYRQPIIDHLTKKVNFNVIKSRDLTDEEWGIARTTGTNLTCLTEDQVNFLIRQAENFTELQVRLYCPSLIASK